MTAATAAIAGCRPARRGPRPATSRLLWLELRHNAMLWILPAAIALFWFVTYRKTMAMPPLWNVRAANVQSGAVADFITPVVGAAAWMGTREARRRTTDLVTITARPAWVRLLVIWAATSCWALAGYLICLAATYGATAGQASWGGPLWWPAIVAGASMPALAALGFAVGTLVPTRFTAPVAAVVAFFVLALSTELIVGSQSYWQVSPLISGPWDIGPDPGVATFYPYLPDLSIAQLLFLGGVTLATLATLGLAGGRPWRRPRAVAAAAATCGVLAAGTAVVLAGTGRLDAHGMIEIPALHDAASDRPLRFTPVCSHGAIPVCLNPAYADYLPATAAALAPVLREVGGLPFAPVRISQVAALYQQGPGNSVEVTQAGPNAGSSRVFPMLLPDQLLGPPMSAAEFAADVRSTTGPSLLAYLVGLGPSASAAQDAVWSALMMKAGRLPWAHPPGDTGASGQGLGPPTGQPDPAAFAAARRFAALPAAARRAWLVRHVAALRAGQITLAQLP
jgi:hypothetical protein